MVRSLLGDSWRRRGSVNGPGPCCHFPRVQFSTLRAFFPDILGLDDFGATIRSLSDEKKPFLNHVFMKLEFT